MLVVKTLFILVTILFFIKIEITSLMNYYK